MEFNEKRYVSRGIPKLSKDLAKAISRGIEKGERIYGPFEHENPHLREIIDYRQFEVGKNLERKITISNLTIEDLETLSQREFLLEASLAYQGLFYASTKSAELSRESGLPILTSEIGADILKLYTGLHKISGNSDEFLDFLREIDPLLCKALKSASKRYLDKNRRFPLEIDDLKRIKNRFKHMGNLGSEILYDALRKQNQSYRLEDQFKL